MPKHRPNAAELLTRGVAEVIELSSLEEKLRSGRPLRVKHGIDPTTADLHLGHAVVHRKLKQFQDAGHTIIFLIGDFTARFGDPTDEVKMRTLRSATDVEAASQSYLKQIGMILDLRKTEIRRNSEWYDKLSAAELLKLMSHFTTQRLLERDMFAKRLKRGQEVRLHEPVYPVLQAYDSVRLKADLTVIGSDQTFNELQARELQRDFDQPPQDLVLMPLLRGTDGKRKMSQSLGNTVGLIEPPSEMYGKVMSIPDNLIGEWFRLCTEVPETEIKTILSAIRNRELNPRDAKRKLAHAIVTLYHSRSAADTAQEEFTTVFQKKGLPHDLPELEIHGTDHLLLDLLVSQRLVASRSEGRRLMTQGGVKLDGKPLTDWTARLTVRDQMVIQLGPRRFYRLRLR